MSSTRRDVLFHLGLGALVAPAALRSKSSEAANHAHHIHHHRTQMVPAKHVPLHAPRVPVTSSMRAPDAHHISVTKTLPRHHKHAHHKKHPHTHAKNLRAQRTLDTPGNRRDLALTMWAEGRSHGELGMRAVGHVIMNRVKLDEARFGHGVSGVCHKRKHFSCWNKGDPNLDRMADLPTMSPTNPDWIAFQVADKLAGLILAGADKDNTGGASFYCASYMIPYWASDMTIVGVMFGHTFYKEKKHKKHTHDSHHKGHKGEYHHSHKSHHHISH